MSEGEKISFLPPSSPALSLNASELIAHDEAEINATFLNALGVVHHNPNISFDTEMTDQVPGEIEVVNG